MVLVQQPNGAWFLPCGEIEAGENHQEALKRELIEELGFTAEIGTYYGQVDEYFYSRHRDTYYYNPAYLYEATPFKEVQKPLENFNHIAWFPTRLSKTLNVVAINGPLNLGKNSIRLANTLRK
ncbi:NUDIX hydrolase [Streptococcus pneumoniae]|nr:NUDIX hydrolase [Streptococcus pneumoniae]MCM0231782.1 NUDIX hydrolase [Streptococcus pneumoniae]MDG8793377.1 NUDIX hydrolase [Streptococcus pneumoniae]MDG8839067.1 NUDIX hydrolase [Streptococcus pneumoniae]MDG9287656.1 NUDIX hydrolase [Streptococcus pneumoniae]MDV8234408.1 NUDIX hydrolase [Streptococcus pneumoniae]